jgi:hypothetical protein
MTYYEVTPKKERDRMVITQVRRLRALERELMDIERRAFDRRRSLASDIDQLATLCPHQNKKWWQGDIGEGWECRDCGALG